MRITPKDILWALLSGILITLPFLNFSLAPLAWVALIPLILVCSGRRVREGVLLGFLAGIIFGYGGVFWLARVTAGGYAVLGGYLALYLALWGGWISWIDSRKPGWVWWAAPVGWVALEYLRTYLFSGFPWNLLGISQVRIIPLIQISAITGVYGVSFLLVLVNAVLAYLWLSFHHGSKRRRWISIVVVIGIISGTLIYGFRVPEKKELNSSGEESLAVTLIQGGILQELKWKPSLAAANFKIYLELSREALESGSDLVIWPESALPYYIDRHKSIQRTLSRLATKGDSCLLIGGDYRPLSPPGGIYNSAYFFTPGETGWERYDKTHLVPFGEYTPLKRFLPFISSVVPWEEDFSAGEDIILFNLPRSAISGSRVCRLGTLICFEDIFPGLVRDMVLQGAGLLVNITNDAWYGRTIAPYQHAYASIFRAIENRIYLARSTNTGYSCIIDPYGNVVGEVVDDETGETLFISDWTTINIPYHRPGSFYTRRGDLFIWICILLSLIAVGACIIQPKHH
ncbi:MAG: apolipoprotein N-acyltransferase [Candidatus Auribacterota bacterium]|nr:apolipoprotein N-acyltransferase [Candidatus Auribacterota bacterium]